MRRGSDGGDELWLGRGMCRTVCIQEWRSPNAGLGGRGAVGYAHAGVISPTPRLPPAPHVFR